MRTTKKPRRHAGRRGFNRRALPTRLATRLLIITPDGKINPENAVRTGKTGFLYGGGAR